MSKFKHEKPFEKEINCWNQHRLFSIRCTNTTELIVTVSIQYVVMQIWK